jgi:hypothetical protein
MNSSEILKKCGILLQKNSKLLPKTVRIVEVGPRDGLQNETMVLSPEYKSEMILSLLRCGIKHIETGAFVSPKWVPQMANSDTVMELLQKETIPDDAILSALVPNVKGMERGKDFFSNFYKQKLFNYNVMKLLFFQLQAKLLLKKIQIAQYRNPWIEFLPLWNWPRKTISEFVDMFHVLWDVLTLGKLIPKLLDN